MPGLSSTAYPGSLRESGHRLHDLHSSSSLSDANPPCVQRLRRQPCPSGSSSTFTPSTMSATDRDLTKAYSRAEFVGKLRRLADSIEAGKSFTIQVAGERLRIPADARFNVEHERSGSEEELEFQLLWTRP